jgi:hypothetical protein
MSGSSRPAQARPEGLRGAVAGRGPRQVPVVHDPSAGRLPAHRHRLDQHRHLVRAAEPQVPPPTAPSGSSPPVLVGMLRQHLHAFGTTPDERLFGAAAAACSANRSTAAPGPPPARPRPARSWPPPRSPAAPATCARRAVLVAERQRGTRRGRRPGRYQRPCPVPGLPALHREPRRHRQPADRRRPRRTPIIVRSSRCVKGSGCAHRRLCPGPCPQSVREPVPGPAQSPREPGPADPEDVKRAPALSAFPQLKGISIVLSRCLRTAGSGPRIGTGHSRQSDEPLPFHAVPRR